MRKNRIVLLSLLSAALLFFSFSRTSRDRTYTELYTQRLTQFSAQLQQFRSRLAALPDSIDARSADSIRAEIYELRLSMKADDFWMRYLEPQAYRLINGPLPVEWETEVFEKFEKPYRRNGAGLTLAALYLDEPLIARSELTRLIDSSVTSVAVYTQDSIVRMLDSYHHFYLCNRLFLLNLAAIYTTGFECPDQARIIPELRRMLNSVASVYRAYNSSFPEAPLSASYLQLFDSLQAFVAVAPASYDAFDHYTFIRTYVNPLFVHNQKLIEKYRVVSHSMLDYSLNKHAASVFDKSLYRGQSSMGIYHRVSDSADIAEIRRVGKLLFYDPILSGNNRRSCASCHKPEHFFADTVSAPLHFDGSTRLPRNTPSLVNAPYNHLLMLDGKHITLQNQGRDVITNHAEMMCSEEEVLKKVLSCKEYKSVFRKMLKWTPQEPEITMEHIVSALTVYYGRFSSYYAPFDSAMNGLRHLSPSEQAGFNLFMGKAQCATCHFVPQFNGVKPPYVGSEFEVLGVPADVRYSRLSSDSGRYRVHPAEETFHAFRTGTVRNAAHTFPYMHNGVFRTLEQVIDFYDAGGGQGHGLTVPNQTLSADSLHLSVQEKEQMIAFIRSLNEQVQFELVPETLPASGLKALKNRKSGGEY